MSLSIRRQQAVLTGGAASFDLEVVFLRRRAIPRRPVGGVLLGSINMSFRYLTKVEGNRHTGLSPRGEKNTAYSIAYGPPPCSLEHAYRACLGCDAGLPGCEHGQVSANFNARPAYYRADQRQLRQRAAWHQSDPDRHHYQYGWIEPHGHTSNRQWQRLQHFRIDPTLDLGGWAERHRKREVCASRFRERNWQSICG